MSVRGGGVTMLVRGGGYYVSKGVTDSVREVSMGGYCSIRGLLTQIGGVTDFFSTLSSEGIRAGRHMSYRNLDMENTYLYLG